MEGILWPWCQCLPILSHRSLSRSQNGGRFEFALGVHIQVVFHILSLDMTVYIIASSTDGCGAVISQKVNRMLIC